MITRKIDAPPIRLSFTGLFRMVSGMRFMCLMRLSACAVRLACGRRVAVQPGSGGERHFSGDGSRQAMLTSWSSCGGSTAARDAISIPCSRHRFHRAAVVTVTIEGDVIALDPAGRYGGRPCQAGRTPRHRLLAGGRGCRVLFVPSREGVHRLDAATGRQTAQRPGSAFCSRSRLTARSMSRRCARG